MTNLRSKIGSKSHKNEYVEKITGFDVNNLKVFTVMLPLKIQVLVLNQNNIDLFETIDMTCDTMLLLNYYQKIIL